MTKPVNPFPPRLSPDGNSLLCDQCGREWKLGEKSGCPPCMNAPDVPRHAAASPDIRHISRIEYGPTPEDTKAILSDGSELAGLISLTPHEVGPGNKCHVTLTAILKETDNA